MIGEKTNTLVIKTPEGIAFSLLLAGPVTRFFAWVIDLACIIVIGSTLSSFMFIFGSVSPDFAQAAMILMYFVISISYGIVFEWIWRGQTLGKRLLKLRVVDEQGLRLQFSQIVVRNLLRFIDALPALYLVGGIACLINRRSQRLGDFAANTIVVRTRPSIEPDLDQIMSGKYNSLHDYPHIEARLRQRVSPEEAALALKAIMHRSELDPNARVDLLRDITAHLKTIVTFPEEAMLGITDEQYIRNVVDTLFRTQKDK